MQCDWVAATVVCAECLGARVLGLLGPCYGCNGTGRQEYEGPDGPPR